jgi:hypothetical protein
MSIIGSDSAPSSIKQSAASGRGIVAIILLLFVLSAVFSAQRKDVTQGFDEVAHVSYVAALQKSGELWPALGTLKMLDPATFRFTGEPNYLNHPPLFYLLLARLGPILENHPEAIFLHRYLNIIMSVLGLAPLMAIGLAAPFERLRLYAYCIPLACIPVLAPLAGAVNNDNAAFAGGTLATLAAWQLVANGRTVWLLAVLAGVVVAAWAKLTGLMLAGGMVAAVLLYLLWRGRFQRAWVLPILCTAVLAAAPYALFIAQYGSPTPSTPGLRAMFDTGARAAGWADAERLSFPAYAAHFVSEFVIGWIPALAERNALNLAMLAIPILALLYAGAGLMLSLRRIFRREETTLDVIVAAGSAAIAATFACHLIYSYGNHLATGWMMEAYPRYYLPLAAIVPLAGLSLLSAVESSRWRAALAGFFIAGPLLFRLFGGPLG